MVSFVNAALSPIHAMKKAPSAARRENHGSSSAGAWHQPRGNWHLHFL